MRARIYKNKYLIAFVAQDFYMNNSMQSLNSDDIILDQNNPNPFSETTEIDYYIPSKYKPEHSAPAIFTLISRIKSVAFEQLNQLFSH